MRSLFATLLLGAALTTAGSPALASDTEVLATVNGKPITEEMLRAYQAQRSHRHQGAGKAPSREQALKELIDIELVTQDAERKKVDQQPEVVRELKWHRRSVLVSKNMRDYLSAHPVDEAEMKAAYENLVAKQGGKEFHARHILVKTEDEAKAVIKALDGGADFASLAKEKSTGPTGKNGGDLGWFGPEQMVKPFADAVASMEKGSYSKTPVQTQFGWHVILLEDSRDTQPPSYEEVKPQIRSMLQNKRIDEFLGSLRSKAKIDINK
ncbi:peptidylprolyl isomerase [Thiohalobacter sp. IOR34]|uniref:peptidylprolyl isomerase n=1 Tax=Thiohalobacter sp. IOR34 TaxID=3057176 RepID=UPI0025AF992E|nr:peptidylprolyl isomerase [Thiohalobacter sp. IOR34]WJW76643.1 peptidylprolyl isomerase [Thiohalobacter sp. IOR34]